MYLLNAETRNRIQFSVSKLNVVVEWMYAKNAGGKLWMWYFIIKNLIKKDPKPSQLLDSFSLVSNKV